MWSNFAARAAPLPPQQPQQPDPLQSSTLTSTHEPEEEVEGPAAGGGWEDDLELEYDELQGLPGNTDRERTDIPPSNVLGSGGLFSSTIQSFTPAHEPLSLSLSPGGPPAAPLPAAPADHAPQQAAGERGDCRGDEPGQARSSGLLGRAADKFGAALLAQLDEEEERAAETRPGPHDAADAGIPDEGAERGFGSGFVMKGLSRFIEAATAPQGEDRSDNARGDPAGDGWGDEDDFDFNQETPYANSEDIVISQTTIDEQLDPLSSQQPELEEEALDETDGWGDETAALQQLDTLPSQQPELEVEPLDEPDGWGDEPALQQLDPLSSQEPELEDEALGETDDGWGDDVDFSFNSDLHTPHKIEPNQPAHTKESTTSGDINPAGVSNNIAAFVAQTESALDDEFRNTWKTPPPRGTAARAAYDDRQDVAKSKSYTAVEAATTPTEAEEKKSENISESLADFVDDLMETKLDDFSRTPASVAADGKIIEDKKEEGMNMYVVHGEDQLEPDDQPAKGELLQVDGVESSLPKSSNVEVGMPLSEMPSTATANSVLGSVHEKDPMLELTSPVTLEELQCKCLELVMPLPDGNDGMAEENSGFGTKRLPDGTSVLVNYEKLLQNEATKRILLQRSFDSYKTKYDQSVQSTREQERVIELQNSELTSQADEIARLNEMLARVQGEMANDKEYLQKEMDLKDEQQRSLQSNLDETKVELTRLVDHVEKLQADLAESEADKAALLEQTHRLEGVLSSNASLEAESKALRSSVESLHQESANKDSQIEMLNLRVQELDREAKASVTSVDEELKIAVESLRNEIKEKDSQIYQMTNGLSETKSILLNHQDENEALRDIQQDYIAQISELKATIETMEGDSVEVEKLAAEVASLQYEMSVKSTEYDLATNTIQSLQSRVDLAETQLSQNGNQSSEVESVLREQLEGTRKLLAEEKSGYDSALEKHANTVRGLESQVQTLTEQLSSSSILLSEVSQLKTLLDLKTEEIEQSCATIQSVEADKTALEKCLEEREAEFQGLEAQLLGLNAQLTNFSTQESQLKASLDAKAAECGHYSSTVQTLESRLVDTEARLEKCLESQKGSSQDEHSLRTKVDGLKIELNVLQESWDALASDKASLEGLLQEKTTTNDAMSVDVVRMQDEVSNLRGALDDKATECLNLTRSFDSLRIERDDLLKKIQAGEHQIQQRVEQLQNELEQESKHNASYKSQNEDLRARVIQAEKILHETSQANADAISEYTQEISRLQADSQQLSKSLEATQLELETKKQDISLTAKVNELQASLVAMKQETDIISQHNRELTDSNTRLQQEKTNISQSLEARATAAERQIDSLKIECARYQAVADSSEKTSIEAKKAMAAFEDQLSQLKSRNAQLEDEVFEASFSASGTASKEHDYEALRRERDNLNDEIQRLNGQVEELLQSSRIAEGTPGESFSQTERDTLLARIQELERDSNMENLNELRDELTSMHEERHQLDLDNEELLVQLGLMQQNVCEAEGERELDLESLREQVSTLEARCSALQSQLDKSRLVSAPADQIDQVKSLQESNESLRQTVKSLEHVRQQAQISEEEIRSLRQTLDSLELQLSDKEMEIESARASTDTRDKEIFKLTSENAHLTSRLEDAGQEIDGLQSSVNNFQEDIWAEDEKIFDDDDDVASLGDMLAEDTESDDELRSQIIILAQALERSELHRASALERISSDRKSNAESLRRLGESLKRFYSAVKASDSI